MWSVHFITGFTVGFEFFEDEINDKPVSYFLADLGCVRIQRAEWI